MKRTCGTEYYQLWHTRAYSSSAITKYANGQCCTVLACMSVYQSCIHSNRPPVPTVVHSPANVNLEFINMSAVLITWSYPAKDHSHPPVHFLVRYSHDGDPYVDTARPTRLRSYVFNGMLYGGYYQFQVVAIEGMTYSEPATTDYFINGITGKTTLWMGSHVRVHESILCTCCMYGALSPSPHSISCSS